MDENTGQKSLKLLS